MKTTIDIADGLLSQAQKLATVRNTSFRAIVEEGLRTVIARNEQQTVTPFKLRNCSFSGEGLREEFKNAKWDKIRDAVYGEGEE